jgi:mono/diheme cytochrome c family protein
MMSGKYWKTGAPIKHIDKIVRPSLGDVLRQLISLAVIGAIWLGAVVIAIGLLSPTDTGASVAEASVETPAAPTAVPPTSVPATSLPTATATMVATQPSTNTPTVVAADTPTTEPPTAVPSPTRVDPTATTVVAASPTADTAAPAATLITPGGAVSFSRDVQPIFSQICVKCHGGDETKEGLSLKSYADVMAGSDNGPVIEPGDAANSFLIQQVINGKMPKKGPRLLPAQIRTLSDWVAAGAPNN